jgi:endoglucanase
MMKKCLTIWGILVIFILPINAQYVTKHGQLRVEGTKLKDKNGKEIVLRGMSFGWHNWWPRFYNADAVKWLKNDWNCKVLRAAIGVEPKGGYIRRPKFAMKRLTAVIDAAIKEDIYVLIDWHSHNINTEEAITFFTEMAQKYARYPNIIYEIFNEPDQESWEEVKAYSIKLIETIRKYDSQNIILVGCPHWDQDIHLVADNPITGYDNIMYTVHFYAATHKQYLRDRCDYALNKGIPIFISECCGTKADGKDPIDYPEWEAWRNWMETNQISWINWDIADKKEACSVLLPKVASKGQWKDDQLTESGKYIRSILRKYDDIPK